MKHKKIHLHDSSILLCLLKLLTNGEISFLRVNETVQLGMEFIAVLSYLQVR